MQRASWVRRRTRAQAPLVILLAAMAALVTVAIAGTLSYLSLASTTAVRTVLADAPAEAATVVVQTRVADDPAAQDRALREIVADLLPGVTVHGRQTTPALDLQDATALDGAAVVLLRDADVEEAATLADGAWPAGPGEGALHAAAAEALGVDAGDRLTIGDDGLDIQITGLWRPDDATAPRWTGSPLAAEGMDPFQPSTVGPLLVTTWDGLDLAPFARWVIEPPADLAPADLPVWESGLAALPEAVEAANVPVRGLIIEGTLAETVASTSAGLASVRAAAAVPLVIVAVVSLVATWQIARLLTLLRARETRILLSRGASRRQFRRAATTESVALAGIGGVVGALGTIALSAGRPGAAPALVAVVAAGVIIVLTAVLTSVQLRAVPQIATDDTAAVSGRRRPVLAGSAVILLLAAAAFSTWRITRNGSPLVPGTARVDPLAVSAPALVLVATALLAIALAVPFTRWWARSTARGPGYSPVTEARQVSRHLPVLAVPVVLVMLASAVSTLASAYAGTAESLRTLSAGVANGADVRVRLGPGITGEPAGVPDYVGLDGVERGTGVATPGVRVDGSSGSVTALPAAETGVMSAPEAIVDPAAVAGLLAPDQQVLTGPEIEAEAIEAEVSVAADWAAAQPTFARPPGRTVTMAFVLWNGAEAVTVASDPVNVSSEPGAPPTTAELTVPLPDGPWQLVAVDVQLDTGFEDTRYDVEVSTLHAGATDLTEAVASWDPHTVPMRAGGSELDAEATPLQISAQVGLLYSGNFVMAGTETIRSMPPPPATPEEGIPALVTPAWSEVVLPSGADVTIAGTQLRMHAAGEIAVIPGAQLQRGVLVDLATLQAALLRQGGSPVAVTEIWLAAHGSETPAIAESAAALAGPRAVVTTAQTGSIADPVAAPARVVFVLAAVGALLLAVPAVVAVAVAQAAARRGEVVVLRAVGVGSAQQAASRRAELLWLQLGAVVAGVAAGLGTALLMMPDLVRAATGQTSSAIPLPLSLHVTTAAVLLAVIIAVVVGVALWYGRRVRAQVLDTTWREEVR
ncbi:FtsX-like permease family protein [Ruania alba]|uniref:ABC3 transporter permease C-terminal domain-containing protein n=1 Tax=Ruania alba TaxID=648782 RepID=A0A1H5HV98_9MICO|nr:FtsX-like permease family protein [Ruania alba]SEE31158.1 hypothetical protein SAMN04488554_2060 [Ruania alba]